MRFIGDILGQHGFQIEINEDNLAARVEDQDKDYMLDRIKILGYLSLHARQLDMIMSNPARVEYYRRKINADILKIIAPK